jgi:hypothetical protein
MTFTFKKLRDEIEDKGYDNALNDCLVLLKNAGFDQLEAENYIFNKWLEIQPRRIRLKGEGAVDIIIMHIKREVKK